MFEATERTVETSSNVEEEFVLPYSDQMVSLSRPRLNNGTEITRTLKKIMKKRSNPNIQTMLSL